MRRHFVRQNLWALCACLIPLMDAASARDPDILLRDDLYALNKIAVGFFVNNHCDVLDNKQVLSIEDSLNTINAHLQEKMGGKSQSLSAIQRTAYRHASDLAINGCQSDYNLSLIRNAYDDATRWAQEINQADNREDNS